MCWWPNRFWQDRLGDWACQKFAPKLSLPIHDRCIGVWILNGEDKSYPQHLVDIIDPDETLGVAEYKKLAIQAIGDIASQGKAPFLVGGTAQYIYAVVDNWEIPAVVPQPEIRRELEAKSLEELQALLKEKDPEAFGFVDIKNKRRVVRALEVVMASGELFSKQRRRGESLFDTLFIGIDVPREELNKRIDSRVDLMVQGGLMPKSEVWSPSGWSAPGMNGIGYRQFKSYTEGTETLEDATLRLKHDTRDVAKRQMTWFRRDKRIQWCKEVSEAKSLIKNFYANQ